MSRTMTSVDSMTVILWVGRGVFDAYAAMVAVVWPRVCVVEHTGRETPFWDDTLRRARSCAEVWLLCRSAQAGAGDAG